MILAAIWLVAIAIMLVVAWALGRSCALGDRRTMYRVRPHMKRVRDGKLVRITVLRAHAGRGEIVEALIASVGGRVAR